MVWPANNSRANVGSLFAREVAPFYLLLVTLAVATLVIDVVLHLADLVWVGKWLGILGLALICGSLGYSLRKRKLISRGQPFALLRRHERMAVHSRGFAPAMLTPAVGADWVGCHMAPTDVFHPDPKAVCSTCHNQTDWTAAAIDHTRFFALTGPHDAACTTCHTGGDFTRFTCFGCHEHQQSDLIAEHLEEGTDNCVACHRDAHDLAP